MASIINSTDTGSGGLITTGDSSDELQLQTAETARVTLTNTAVVVNEDGNDVDFRVEGDTNANLLFVDASADAVGIGTNSIDYVSAGRTVVHVEGSAGALLALEDTGAKSYIFQSSNDLLLEVDNASGNMIFGTNNSTERMRLTSDGYLRMNSGTGGIQFGGDTAAANALDDYEEGTWTPAFSVSSGSATYTTQNGTYIKIGRQVTCNFWIVVNVSSSLVTSDVAGLPFTSSASVYYSGASLSSYETGAFSGQCNVMGLIIPNSLLLQLRKTASATSAPSTTSTTITNGTVLTGSFTYFV